MKSSQSNQSSRLLRNSTLAGTLSHVLPQPHCLQSLSLRWRRLSLFRVAWRSDFSIHAACSWLMRPLSQPADSLRVGGGSLGCSEGREESLVRLGKGTRPCLLRMLKHPSLDNPAPPVLGRVLSLHFASSPFHSKELTSPDPYPSTHPSP